MMGKWFDLAGDSLSGAINIVENEIKIIDKVAAYSRIHRATEGLDFGKQNLILSEIASSMRLTHRFGDGVYSLYRRRPYSTEPMGKSLIDLPLIDHATARGLAIALKSTHGGAGRGQGRKPSDGATGLERRNISIDSESDAIAHRAGRDRSSGIREALRFWATHHDKE